MSSFPSEPLRTGVGPPVILFGHGRSGTSIIAALMRNYLGIAFGTESQFILSYLRDLEKFGPLENDQNLRNLVDKILGERWFKRSKKFGEFTLSRDDIIASMEERSFSGVLNAIFSSFATHLSMDRWGDKTPAYIHDMDSIRDLFPEAQFVYVVRDGRDVALSLKQTHFGPKNMFTSAHDWREVMRAGDRFAEQLDEEHLFYIRYEDFLDEPVEIFMRLAGFLNVRCDTLRAKLTNEMLPNIKVGNSNKWMSQFSDAQKKTYDAIAFAELSKHKYETSVREAGKESGWLTHTYWKAMSELGKWRFTDYWKDNLHKVRTRLRR
ncbi:MAG: sulfotransferase [Planctomycetota bacterium]